jgi:predicted transposase YdaD
MSKSPGDTDIFDRSFKKIIESLSNKALIQFINSMFGADHPLDSEVRRLNTEQIDDHLKKQQPDEIVSIGGQDYVIEEQTTDDANMAIRIFEYGYAHAMKNKEIMEGVIILPYPRMIVIYLEASAATPDELIVRLKFPDGSEHDFKVKTVKVLEHSVEELVEQGFTPLLPFYIVKLRKAAKRAKTDEEKAKVEEGFKALGLKLKEAIEQGADRGRFSEEDIVTLLERLAYLVNHIGEGYRTTEVNGMLRDSAKGYGVIMQERGERLGERRGKRLGERRGERLGKRLGERLGKLNDARNALKEGLSIEQVARITEIPADKLLKQLNKPEKK